MRGSSRHILTAENVGSGAPAVPDLKAATLSWKNLLKSSTVIAELAGSRPRPSSMSTDRQRRRGDARSAYIVSHQNELRLAFRSSRYRLRWSYHAAFAVLAAATAAATAGPEREW